MIRAFFFNVEAMKILSRLVCLFEVLHCWNIMALFLKRCLIFLCEHFLKPLAMNKFNFSSFFLFKILFYHFFFSACKDLTQIKGRISSKGKHQTVLSMEFSYRWRMRVVDSGSIILWVWSEYFSFLLRTCKGMREALISRTDWYCNKNGFAEHLPQRFPFSYKQYT